MSKTVNIDESNFEEKVIKSTVPVLVDFWAEWCVPCRQVAPLVDELSEEYAGRMVFGKVDVEENQKIAARYSIMGIPTLLIFKNGEPVSHITGFKPKDKMKEILDDLL